MGKISLGKIIVSDKKYFAKWWQDKELRKLTSGSLEKLSDKEVDTYFRAILDSEKDYHFMLVVDGKKIGHVTFSKRRNGWYETQIIIGDKNYWDKGYGTKAIQLLLRKRKKLDISKIYLEVRPNNTRAIKAYENCGFIRKEIKKYPKNKYLPETLRMELKS